MNRNTPYVKKYENGILINPITESYLNVFPVRIKRRQNYKKYQFNSIGQAPFGRSWERHRNKFFLGKVIAK